MSFYYSWFLQLCTIHQAVKKARIATGFLLLQTPRESPKVRTIKIRAYFYALISALARLGFVMFTRLDMRMFSPGYKIILQILGKITEISTVASYAHNQIPVFFRLLLSSKQGIFIDNVKL